MDTQGVAGDGVLVRFSSVALPIDPPPRVVPGMTLPATRERESSGTDGNRDSGATRPCLTRWTFCKDRFLSTGHGVALLRFSKDNLCDSVEPRNFWLPAEASRLSFMRLCYKLGIATVVLLLPCISAYPAELAIPRNGSLMRAETPSCAVVCGMSWIRPWAPFNGAAIPMPYDGGLFDCDSGPTPHPSDATRQAAVRGSTESRVVSARAPSTPRVETTARRARLDDLN